MNDTFFNDQAIDGGYNLGPLALVVPLLEQVQVRQIIDQHLPVDPQAEFSHGQVLSLLLAARLYRPTALCNVASWAQQSGADLLWQIPCDKMNDDRLGRSLDAFFTQRHSILASVALHVSQEFDISLEELHYDPTHLVFYGQYENSEPRIGEEDQAASHEETASDPDLSPAQITHGRPLGGVPKKAKTVHAGLATAVDQYGAVPLFGNVVSGNENGHTSVAEQFRLIKKHLQPKRLLMISDRGTFSVGHLLRLHQEGFYGLCSAPWKDFRELYDQHRDQLHWQPASYLSQEQQRRREVGSSLPQESYSLACLETDLTDEASGQAVNSRVLFAHSTAEAKVAAQQREKSRVKIQQGLEDLAQKVREGRRSTAPDDVGRRIAKLMGNRGVGKYFCWAMVELNEQEQQNLPAPQRGCRRATHRLEFSFDEQGCQAEAAYDGLIAIVTTAPKDQGTADELFTKFKEQHHSEKANRVWKNPIAVHPVYLKSPERVEALVFLLMLALTVYHLLERKYRQQTPPESPQAEHRMTAERLLRAFACYVLVVHWTEVGRVLQPTRLTSSQSKILSRLGFPTPAQILRATLPQPPPEISKPPKGSERP